MTGQATRLQVSGHRFSIRRMQHALVRADVRMIDDPLRAQQLSLASGTAVAVVAVALCAVLTMLRPGDDVGGAPVVVVAQTGALYVTVQTTVHPVPNLASARLITGFTGAPKTVSQRAIDNATRGPALGIPGAPGHLGQPSVPTESDWTVCDDEQGHTTVIAGSAQDLADEPRSNVLVALRGNPAATYLLHDGWRSRVDLRHPAVLRALELDRAIPQPVSSTVLASLPEAPQIAPPRIPAAGASGPSVLGGLRVGAVFAVPATAGGQDHYVVLSDGVQRIGQVVADLIRYTDPDAGHQIPVLAPDVVGGLPVRTSLAVATFPERAGAEPAPVVCTRWRPDGAVGTSHSTVVPAASLPSGRPPQRLVQADGAGPAVDAVAIPAGRHIFVRSSGLTGVGQQGGPLFLVTDTGMVFGVGDHDAAARLGLTEPAVPAPWPILATLPRGPELTRHAASVVRDAAP
ncbi:type VII secretion protein EccB [Mycobacterium sp. SMC-4]|uniref:type VII secretion protein EccB n=1 Tax=Mycobacterium sp. SMC-4 TaxID=2857059 RepID=UPI0021B1D58B|nr:type VII secretion protein EccB [Mycobacterium sp. SMC-4]UXA19026.1 type VII secretion protein EccB [Mycobacterium sp. SMC-4]